MANLSGTNLSAAVVPFTTEDIYPTHMAAYGKGGWRSVSSVDELSKIPPQRLEDGCVVYVESEGKSYLYQNSEWVDFDILLPSKQNTSDDNLQTTDKTIVGAINEVFNSSGDIDLTNYYTKEETDQEIEEYAYVSARAFDQIKETLGTDNSLKVSFEGLQFLNSSTSILNAIQLIDGLVNTLKTEIANIDVKKNLPIKVVGLSGAYTIKLAGEIGGSGEYTIEGNTLICDSDTIEGNTLVLFGGAIEGNILVL